MEEIRIKAIEYVKALVEAYKNDKVLSLPQLDDLSVSLTVARMIYGDVTVTIDLDKETNEIVYKIYTPDEMMRIENNEEE